jgi:hypothetical protein
MADEHEMLAVRMSHGTVADDQWQGRNGGCQKFLQAHSHDLLPGVAVKIGIYLPNFCILVYIFHIASIRQAGSTVRAG